MKIGLSYSRCVRDIVDGKVDINDVLILITRTDFDPHDDEQWADIWEGYAGGNAPQTMRGLFGGSNPEWFGTTDEDEDRYRSVSIELWEQGKFHQPRKFGAHPIRRPEIWLEAVLPNSELDKNPAAKKAFEKFQMIAGLSSVELDDKYR
jgi:flavodoxin